MADYRKMYTVLCCAIDDVIEVVVLNGFVLGKYLTVFTKERMERLELDVRLLDQLNLLVALGTWHEVIDVNVCFAGTYTVHTTNALHQAC